MYRWVLAWRWLRSLPILWVSVAGVVLSVASTLVVDSIFNGVLRDLRRVMRGSTSDLVVLTQAPAYDPAPLPTAAIVRELLAVEGVAGAAARLQWHCILPEGLELPEVVAIGAISRRSMLELVGVEPADEASVSDLPRFLAAAPPERRVPDLARPFDVGDLDLGDLPAVPILLGDRCAQALRLARGSTLELMTLPLSESGEAEEDGVHARSARFVVAGTFATESFIEDLTRAYVHRRDLQRFAGTPTECSEIAVKAVPGADLDRLREAMLARIEPFGLTRLFQNPILRWDELESKTLLAIENQRGVLGFVLFFIVIVAGFNLLVSIHLLVTEKLRDAGTLAALGGSALGIASIFGTLGLLVTLLGSGLGMAGGFLLASRINEVHDVLAGWLGRRLWGSDIYLFERIPVDFDPRTIGFALIVTFAVTLLFGFLGSLRAARLDPIESLRHE